MEHWKVQERDLLRGGPSTSPGTQEVGGTVWKQPFLFPKTKKVYEGLSRILEQCCQSPPTLYIPKGMLFLFIPINLAIILKLLPCMRPLKFLCHDTARTHFHWQQLDKWIWWNCLKKLVIGMNKNTEVLFPRAHQHSQAKKKTTFITFNGIIFSICNICPYRITSAWKRVLFSYFAN